MLNEYDDITSRLGEPKWHDVHGVPRYVRFSPRKCGVYIRFVAYTVIACQDCGQQFHVAVERDQWKWLSGQPTELPTSEHVGSFHYGDPPRHGCVGDTMNCETVRIKQFWRRDQGYEWERDRSLEFSYEPSAHRAGQGERE